MLIASKPFENYPEDHDLPTQAFKPDTLSKAAA